MRSLRKTDQRGGDTEDYPNESSRRHWFSFKSASIVVNERSPVAPRGDLLFLHGRIGQGAMWDPIIARLASHFRCLSLDFPGFGQSFSVEEAGFSLSDSMNLVCQLIAYFVGDSQKIVLAGHDVGGSIAQLAALQDSGRVAGLVLANSISVSERLEPVSLGFRGFRIRRQIRSVMGCLAGMDRIAGVALRNSWEQRELRAQKVRALRALERSWPGFQERRFWKQRLSGLVCPVLVISGARDSILSRHMGFELMRQHPESYFSENPETGYWTCLESPDWVVAKIRDFFFRRGLFQAPARLNAVRRSS